MAREFSEIKKNAEELTENIEALSREILSFKEAKESLNDAADAILKASDQLRIVVDNSGKMLEEVEAISTERTLNELHTSAEVIKEACSTMESLNDEAVKSMLKTNQETLKKITDSNDDAIVSMDKKVKIMGAISIACSLIAIILAFVR